jgi:NAD(P)-dependent dehydrogenase (short-subunit alcohol dehydrogenase family)
MASIHGKVALVTGAVYAAARRTDRMAELEQAGARVIALDVTSEESIASAISKILSKERSIDILVNNAGYGSYGAIEDVPLEEARRQFDVNVFGLERLTQFVLPGMGENHYGKIVNISSMGGKIYTPFGGWYHATKHAVEGLTDCLRLETTGFGIDPVVIEPGGVATDWGVIAAENLKKASGTGAYAEAATTSADQMAATHTSGRLTKPEVIATVIMEAVTARRPKTRYVAGRGARLAILLRRIFGDRFFDRVVLSTA